MKPLLVALLLGLAATPALPLAAAGDPCGQSETLLRTRLFSVGAFTGEPCVGGHFVLFLPCVQVHWGVMTQVAGVGGHHGCETRAYAALP